MSAFVTDFINSLKLSRELEKNARVLITTVEDCEVFQVDFLDRNRYIVDDLLDYREYKLSILELTTEDFLVECNGVASQLVFEKFFLQPFNSIMIDLINGSIESSQITLEYIYTSFQKNNNVNIMKYVL